MMQSSISLSRPIHNKANNKSSPNEIFVGDLSFFCTEDHILQLFGQFGLIENVRIIRGGHRKRSLTFGFVTMSSVQEARHIVNLFNNHMFMGRKMKVELSDSRRASAGDEYLQGYQVHVAFCSSFSLNNIIVPTEAVIRRIFVQFGQVLDVSVKEYIVSPVGDIDHQQGYGFVTFAEESSAYYALKNAKGLCADGITFDCTPSHRGSGQMHSVAIDSHFYRPPTSNHHKPTPFSASAEYFRHDVQNQNNCSSTVSSRTSFDSFTGSSVSCTSMSQALFPNIPTTEHWGSVSSDDGSLFSSMTNSSSTSSLTSYSSEPYFSQQSSALGLQRSDNSQSWKREFYGLAETIDDGSFTMYHQSYSSQFSGGRLPSLSTDYQLHHTPTNTNSNLFHRHHRFPSSQHGFDSMSSSMSFFH